jgi:hypothetical protein
MILKRIAVWIILHYATCEILDFIWNFELDTDSSFDETVKDPICSAAFGASNCLRLALR